jgi:hypothetical protein
MARERVTGRDRFRPVTDAELPEPHDSMTYDPLLLPVFGVTIWGCTVCGCLIAAGPSFERHRDWHQRRGEVFR